MSVAKELLTLVDHHLYSGVIKNALIPKDGTNVIVIQDIILELTIRHA